jgi:hypothetical protein
MRQVSEIDFEHVLSTSATAFINNRQQVAHYTLNASRMTQACDGRTHSFGYAFPANTSAYRLCARCAKLKAQQSFETQTFEQHASEDALNAALEAGAQYAQRQVSDDEQLRARMRRLAMQNVQASNALDDAVREARTQRTRYARQMRATLRLLEAASANVRGYLISQDDDADVPSELLDSLRSKLDDARRELNTYESAAAKLGMTRQTRDIVARAQSEAREMTS